jgi:hypothetical protein
VTGPIKKKRKRAGKKKIPSLTKFFLIAVCITLDNRELDY